MSELTTQLGAKLRELTLSQLFARADELGFLTVYKANMPAILKQPAYNYWAARIEFQTTPGAVLEAKTPTSSKCQTPEDALIEAIITAEAITAQFKAAAE